MEKSLGGLVDVCQLEDELVWDKVYKGKGISRIYFLDAR